MSQLLQNAVRIIGEDLYLKSEHQHDYVSHAFKDVVPPLHIDVDGGLAYAKRSSEDFLRAEPLYEEWVLTTDDPFDHIAAHLLWGTRGPAGDQPLTYRPIKELAYRQGGIDHLKAILANCLNISPIHKRVVEHWLAVREAETS